MPERDILVAANEVYADGFTKGHLPTPPGRQLAIVTCMDARLDPAKFLGLEEGDAHVIRNAGGLVTEDAIRSLIISHWLLGTQEFAVVAHTDCGMLTFSNDDIHAKLEEATGADASDIDFHPFPDLEGSVRASVQAIRESPLLPNEIPVSGWVYDVGSGRITEVPLEVGVA
ncbi:MAG TPA: carbonic anhydrase [Gaiellaceae bacterium]|nr:carbonic anhydrase [Gaiellaceae bacterium]